MPRNFYFGPEAGIVKGSANFAQMLSTSGAALGVSPAQAAAFGAADATLQAAYTAAVDPSTRTRGAVLGKRDAIRSMRAMAIHLGHVVYSNPDVTDQQLIGLGLQPRSTRQRIDAPGEPPVVSVGVVSGRLVNLRIQPQGTARRGFPYGMKGANLYSYVGQTPPTDPRAFHFEGLMTRSILQLQFPDSVVSGATVWVSACWVSGRGETSPACAPVRLTIQGGSVLPQAA